MSAAWEVAWSYFWRSELTYLYVGAALLALLLWRYLPADRRGIRNTVGLFLLGVAGQLIAGLMAAAGSRAGAATVYELGVVAAGLAIIRLGGLFVFRLLLPGAGLRAPRIVEDILVILAYVVFALARMRMAGVDLSGIIATSAVITAVLAFSMQDTLGNILGGLALQLDNSIEIGDWVKFDDVSGRVTEIRWRHTAIETRNGETVIVPNSLLMKNRFTVVWSSRTLQPWRRWVWFEIDYGTPPSRVIETAEQAVLSAAIPNVAPTHAPTCVLMEFGHGYGRYALRYWLTDPRADDPTDSAVRAHVFAALQRAGMRLAVPESSLHLIKEDDERRAQLRAREQARRLNALRGIDLFASLSEEELRQLASRLVDAPFVRDDVITRQGMVAHWLYILVAGEAEIWLEDTGDRRLLTTLHAGSVFGEMGLLTGEPRRATVTARSDVQCYRLDKTGFEDIIRSRPAIAGEISATLASRQTQLAEARRALSNDARARETSRQHANILSRVRDFFSLDSRA